MKTKNVILALTISLIFLSSCVVKSLHPFYTQKTIHFNHYFLGNWKDGENGIWKVVTFKKVMETDFLGSKKTKEDKKLLEKYKHSYYVTYTKKDRETVFIATPFKIQNQFFLDFIPTGFGENKNLTDLEQNHLVYTHSLVKFAILPNGNVTIKWFAEDQLKKLFNENRIKIQHEKIGLDEEDYLLTASSEELEAFLQKYVTPKNAEKWETSTKFTLTKSK